MEDEVNQGGVVMEVTEVLMRIEDLMKERNLSPYQLAKKMNVMPRNR